MRVQLYRNLSPQYRGRRAWSIMAHEGPQKGRVIDVVDGVVLKNAIFVVREGGRQRVLREKQKNVHAFVQGELERVYDLDSLTPAAADALLARGANVRVGYDPYRMSTFQREDCGQPVTESPLVVAAPKGVYAKLPACAGVRGLGEVDVDLNRWNG